MLLTVPYHLHLLQRTLVSTQSSCFVITSIMHDSLKLVVKQFFLQKTLSPRLDFSFVPNVFLLIVVELCLLLMAGRRIQTVVVTFPECSNPDDNDDEDDGFWCDYNKKCIPISFLCDGDNDCGNWEDEDSDCANSKQQRSKNSLRGERNMKVAHFLPATF